MREIILMDSQIKSILAHLQSVGFKCGCCDGIDLDIQSLLGEIKNFDADTNLVIGVPVSKTPIVEVICKRCSNIICLSATYLGLLPSNNPGFKPIL